jgi:LuxR family maltose regulon positive regulatory protein
LQMAAISMQKCQDIPAFIDTFTGNHRHVLDYLTGEVLNQQTENTRSFLFETSILNHLSAPLCDAVTGRHDGLDMLKQLETANMFLVPLDNERQWYRYHPLFASLLTNRLWQNYPEHITELNKRAANWLSQNGYQDEAIPYALASGDSEMSVQLIESTIEERMFRTELYTIQYQLSRLPEEAFPV